MIKNVNKKLKQREINTLARIDSAQKASMVLRLFFDKGFTNFDALKAIVVNYYPEVQIARLWDYWHFRIVDESMNLILEDVFEKLKSE